MRKYSTLLKKFYDDDNVVYLTNMIQVARYMKAGAVEDFVDLLYFGTNREDTLVFVFNKTPLIKELYRKWQAHELN